MWRRSRKQGEHQTFDCSIVTRSFAFYTLVLTRLLNQHLVSSRSSFQRCIIVQALKDKYDSVESDVVQERNGTKERRRRMRDLV